VSSVEDYKKLREYEKETFEKMVSQVRYKFDESLSSFSIKLQVLSSFLNPLNYSESVLNICDSFWSCYTAPLSLGDLKYKNKQKRTIKLKKFLAW
jgi:hypothetical protein